MSNVVGPALLAVAGDLAELALLLRQPLPGLAETAAVNRLSGLTYSAVQQVGGVDPAILGELRAASFTAAGDHLRMMADMKAVLERLEGRGIPALVFKGPVLAELAYDEPWHRSYVDLDIAVAYTLADALETLADFGGQVIPETGGCISG